MSIDVKRIAVLNFAALVALVAIALGARFLTVGSGVQQPSVAVAYADLNPAVREDAEILYARLQTAARQVCEPVAVRHGPHAAAAQRCFEQALADAVGRVGENQLTALHGQSTLTARAD